jgi:hypothetical protein
MVNRLFTIKRAYAEATGRRTKVAKTGEIAPGEGKIDVSTSVDRKRSNFVGVNVK